MSFSAPPKPSVRRQSSHGRARGPRRVINGSSALHSHGRSLSSSRASYRAPRGNGRHLPDVQARGRQSRRCALRLPRKSGEARRDQRARVVVVHLSSPLALHDLAKTKPRLTRIVAVLPTGVAATPDNGRPHCRLRMHQGCRSPCRRRRRRRRRVSPASAQLSAPPEARQEHCRDGARASEQLLSLSRDCIQPEPHLECPSRDGLRLFDPA